MVGAKLPVCEPDSLLVVETDDVPLSDGERLAVTG
jgi:hypothetical protein